ncbi:MAG TPA: hypothetical protein VFR84_13865 [Candidatus Angelobacter sp.]|nr:hypothetical protein [Candidatus Angelobacter sp.]
MKALTPPIPINYQAVLADLEAKRVELDSAIAAIKVLLRQTGLMAATAPVLPRISSLSEVPPNAFAGLSISRSVRRLLEMMQRRLSVAEILRGLEAGGLKRNKYRNVYSILRGREAYQADIIKVDRKWGLAEWNPEIPPRSNQIPPHELR